MSKLISEFIFLRTREKRASWKFGLKPPAIAVVSPEGERLGTAAGDDVGSLSRLLEDAAALYRDHPVEWAASPRDVLKEKARLVLVVAGDDEFLKRFGDKSLALLQSRLSFVHLKLDSEEARALKLDKEPGVIALYVTDQDRLEELRRDDGDLKPAQIKKFIHSALSLWSELQESR